jgi:circadian clock protein KaiB
MSRRALFKFRLYVAGDTQNSAQAVANLTALCRAHLPDRHEIEVVDVFREPKRALADGIFMTPTLVKLAPSPVRSIIGTLSRTELVLQALGLETLTARTRENHRQPVEHAGRHRSRLEAFAT